MDTHTPDQLSWKAVMAGVLPFLVSGPLLVILSYPSVLPEWMTNPAWLLGAALVAAPIGIGFAAGWRKGFPFWAYAYLCLVLVFCLLTGSALLSGSMSWTDHKPVIIFMVALAVLFALLLISSRASFSVRNIREDFSDDWTRLSLGLMVLPTAVFSGIDGDEYPTLTVAVIAPGVIFSLAALLGLRVKSGKIRAGIITTGMLLSMVIRVLDGQWPILIYWVLLAFLVYSPFLLQKQKKRSLAHTS